MTGERSIYCPALNFSFSSSTTATLFNNAKLEKKTEDEPNETKALEGTDLGWIKFRTKIVWVNAIGFFMLHLFGFYGFLLCLSDLLRGSVISTIWRKYMKNSWRVDTLNSVLMLTFMGGEGTTVGAHRLWAHRSFKAKLPLQTILIIWQTLAGQNCCYVWARDHRQHHKYSDTDADPHNASRGFFFSHIGWLMMKKHPDVIKKGKGVDMSDLEANPIVMFQKKYYKSLYFLIAMVVPVFTPMYLWNETFWRSAFINFFFRYVLLLNITWSVNSVAHMFGTKPYDKNILPVESYFVSFIGLGEGWHNYHHSFPWDYKASEFGMRLNFTSHLIEFFAKIGWAYDLKEASQKVVEGRIQRVGDGTHGQYLSVNYTKDKANRFVEEYKLRHAGNEFDGEEETVRDL